MAQTGDVIVCDGLEDAIWTIRHLQSEGYKTRYVDSDIYPAVEILATPPERREDI